ncbi:hypothetical protein D3C84_1257360 [compost metagenome]
MPWLSSAQRILAKVPWRATKAANCSSLTVRCWFTTGSMRRIFHFSGAKRWIRALRSSAWLSWLITVLSLRRRPGLA